MPQLTEPVFGAIKRCKKFTNYTYYTPFRNLLPPVLKNKVSGKVDKLRTVACLQEMTAMINCFKEHEFDQSVCKKEINIFQNCYNKYMTERQRIREVEAKGLVPGAKKLSSKHINLLFSRYPQPK